jgi:hypothetical protein
MQKFSIFVDPEKIEPVISEMAGWGIEVTLISGGGPEALIHCEAIDEDLKWFVDNNSFEINENSIIYEE